MVAPSLRGIRLEKDSTFIGSDCPYDGYPFREGDLVLICPVDETPHHVACWRANGNHCVTLGCEGQGDVINEAEDPLLVMDLIQVLESYSAREAEPIVLDSVTVEPSIAAAETEVNELSPTKLPTMPIPVVEVAPAIVIEPSDVPGVPEAGSALPTEFPPKQSKRWIWIAFIVIVLVIVIALAMGILRI